MADDPRLRAVVCTRLVTPEGVVEPGETVDLPAAGARRLASVGAVEIAPAAEAPPAGGGGESPESAPQEPPPAPAPPARAPRTPRA